MTTIIESGCTILESNCEDLTNNFEVLNIVRIMYWIWLHIYTRCKLPLSLSLYCSKKSSKTLPDSESVWYLDLKHFDKY